MKTQFAILALALLSQPAFAAKLDKLSRFSNPALEKAYRAAGKDLYTGAFTVVKATPAAGRTAEEVRKNTVAQAAHTLCGFFDDGVSITKASNAASAASDLDLQDNEAEVKAISEALGDAGAKVELYSGSASGNNTMGTVLGAYDRESDEVLVMSSTNCGSDD